MKKTMIAMMVLCGAATGASAQIAPQGDATDGLPHVGAVDGTNGVSSVATWSFWTFSANAGDNINIEVNRLVSALDPVSSVVFGDATGTPFASATGTSIFDWSGPGLSTVIAFGDDDDPANVPGGPWGDPNYGFVAGSTGVYTVAVASYASATPGPHAFEIIVTGSTVPTPGALGLLAMGGLVAARRRR